MHMYDPLKRGGRLCDRLLPNRSITFRPNDNDIIGPFICGVIQRGLKSIMRFPCNCIFEWFMPCSLIIHYSGTTAKRGEMNKSGEKKQQKKNQQSQKRVFWCSRSSHREKKKEKDKMLCRAAVCAVIVSNYMREKLSLPVMKNIFPKNFLLHLRVWTLMCKNNSIVKTETETHLQPVHRGRMYTWTGFQPEECAPRIWYLMLPSGNEYTRVSRDSCEVDMTHSLGCLPISFCVILQSVVIILYLVLSFLARLDI